MKTEIPKTDFLATNLVSRWSVEMYIANLESDVRIWSGMQTETAKARAQMSRQHLEQARRLFGINPETEPKS